MEEIWKDIKEYEGYYQVSNYARVKSLIRQGRIKEFIIKGHITKKGYTRIPLCKNRKVKLYYLHRLVAEAFIANPDNLPYINHKDEDKQNNIPENLEWCDVRYNNTYGTRTQKVKEKCAKPIIQMDMEGNPIRKWASVGDFLSSIGKKYSGSICECCNGKRKSAYGFKWQYAD